MEGIKRGQIVGTEMERLAGSIEGFGFRHQRFGFRVATEKLYHINGTPREEYVPEEYVRQTRVDMDEMLKAGLLLLDQLAD
ncbi:MAG: hypothetical protein AAFV07_19265 [Bacteroidota bacterium]